ncbi:hypothetical protein PC129_g3366 [Phytophthora cactorum]|uniref:Uncharacterized protein n=1 Tax=Phytophthora cactorum TaxID=29920 RepID=A0A329SH73_9STRA|nr:hypothetical protein Pcac1_g22624 [Phytophthora cactorum]KAG2835005.1 hypothetical protein PC112_g5856 [Phytophthora cactorum]KAG2846266.1 hypothetical protein PC111_g1273 [Phytophthora cactorum]KAG2864523.1 hypothetical protein PC113_g4502 [Phytophthora cactorum]KAG2926012.1 hypothetical protein PC114_g3935 [Phytophthora cactorum]
MASSSAPEHANPLQQRAAAAAQALLAPGRSISQREIQAMLEKNEAALKGWNALHKQQPAKTNPVEHKEWVRRCLIFRQQIGARLEVLASLADKQIAHEDEKSGGRRVSPNAAAARQAGMAQNSTLAAPSAATPQIPQQLKPTVPQQGYPPQQIPTMSNSNPMAMTTSTSTSMAMPNMAAPTPPTMFPEPPMPTVGFASTSSSMFFPTGQMNPLQASTGFTSTSSMAVSGVTTSTQGYAMSSGVQTFTPNAYMTSTSGPPSSSAAYMNQQNYMMGGGMMNQQQQQFMPMPMPMNLASSGNMYDNNNYGMPSASTSANSANGNLNSSSNNFPVDPFMTPLGFGPDASYGSAGFPMAGMSSMPIQQQQMMGSMNGVNFGAQGASMMPNNFGYGGMSTSSAPNMMPQSLPTQQFQPTPQPFQQQNQLPQHSGAGSMSMSPDSALYGDSNVNIFEGLTDDAFFPMQ